MKKSFCLLFMALVTILSAQNKSLEGIILDKETNESVPFVSIYSPESLQGTYSNNDGKFKFYFSEQAKTVEIYCLGYKKIVLNTVEVTNDVSNFYLETDVVELEEFIVTDKPASEILNSVLDNSLGYLNKNIELETYYREFVMVNNKYSKFSDGLINFYLEPKRKEKVKSFLEVEQSRAFQITAADEIEKNGKADLSDLDSFFNIQDAVNSFYTFKNLKEITTSKKNTEKYDFEIKSRKDAQGNRLEVVKVIPKPEVEEELIAGEVVYDPVNKVVLDINLQLSEKHKKYIKVKNMLLFKYGLYDFEIRQQYNFSNGKYIPRYKKLYVDLYLKFGKKVDDRLKFTSDLAVTKYHDVNVSIPVSEKLFEGRSLYENGTQIKTEYWKQNNAIPLSEKEEQIIQSLQ